MRKNYLLMGALIFAAVSAAGCGQKKAEETTASVQSEEVQTTEMQTTEEQTTEEAVTEEESSEEQTEPAADRTEEEGADETESPAVFSKEGERAAAFFEEMYARLDGVTLPMFIESREVDLSDSEMTEYQTGLKSAEGIAAIVMSESMVTSSPYSLMYIVPEEGADSDKILDRVMESINPEKWICVQADYVCGVSFGGDLFVMMTDAELGETVYQAAVDTAEEQGLKVGNLVRR